MNKTILTVLVLSSTALLNGCTVDSADNGPSTVEYQSTTGYTVGSGPYNISNGYSPENWTPGYYNYVGYNRGYIGHGYYGGYGEYYGRGGYGHGGYGHGGYRHGGYRHR